MNLKENWVTEIETPNIDAKMRRDMEQGWNESFDKMKEKAEKEAQRPPASDPHRISEGEEARS